MKHTVLVLTIKVKVYVESSCCGATKCFTEASDAWRVENDWVEEFLSIGPMTGRGKVLVVLPREMRNSQRSIRL